MFQTSRIGNLHVYIALFIELCKDDEQELSHFYHVSVDGQGKNIQKKRETAVPLHPVKACWDGYESIDKTWRNVYVQKAVTTMPHQSENLGRRADKK